MTFKQIFLNKKQYDYFCEKHKIRHIAWISEFFQISYQDKESVIIKSEESKNLPIELFEVLYL